MLCNRLNGTCQIKYIVFCFCILVALVGCKRRVLDKKDVWKESTKNACKSILYDPDCSQKSKDCANKVLEEMSNKVIDPAPILCHTSYRIDKKGKTHLCLTMFDEESDILGIIVRETDTNNNVVIEEQYPVFCGENIGHYVSLSFQEKKSGNKKDPLAWDSFLSDPNVINGSMNVYERINKRPPVYISIPEKDKVQVEIAVYDKKGNQSEIMPLESKLYRRSPGWANE